MINTLNFYIGTEEKTLIPEKVLGYTIRKYASCPVTVTSMIGEGWEIPKDIPQGTGFSLRRFLIPLKQNYQGLAVYVDADQVVFSDVKELLDYGNKLIADGKDVACTYQPDKFNKNPWPQSSVMVINCAACSYWKPEELWNKLRNGHNYANFMHLDWLNHPPEAIPVYWNHLDTGTKGQTKLLHYTKEPEQPWYQPKHRLAHLWEEELVDAIKNGVVSKKDLEWGLSRWGKPTGDSRKSNGLNPYYSKYLALAK